MKTYYDGWQDALKAVDRGLAESPDGPTCLDCLVDRVRFEGIAAAAGSGLADPPADNDAISNTVTMLIDTCLEPDLVRRSRLTTLARNLVDDQPGAAVGTVVLLALLAAKRYEDSDDAGFECTRLHSREVAEEAPDPL